MPLSKIVAKSITDDTITTDQIADTSVHGRRNLIINGGFDIAERGTQSAVVGTILVPMRHGDVIHSGTNSRGSTR